MASVEGEYGTSENEGAGGWPVEAEYGAPLDEKTRTWGMLCHLAALVACFGVPFGNAIGPLVVWLIKKDEIPYVDQEGKEALNFQLSMILYGMICVPLILVIVGIFLILALMVVDLILVILAAVQANKGEGYRYPLTIRFLS